MNIIKEKTVAITGHRVLKKDFSTREVENKLKNLILKGYNTFLVGMALGFDSKVFDILNKLKQIFKINLIACVPCENQDLLWKESDKIKYKKRLSLSDEVIFISKQYDEFCMHKRDRFMVDNASVLLCYLYKSTGGAYYTVKYAVDNNKEIIYIK